MSADIKRALARALASSIALNRAEIEHRDAQADLATLQAMDYEYSDTAETIPCEPPTTRVHWTIQ